MSKRVFCDVCRKEVPPDEYGLAPAGWLTVMERGNYKANPDYCSKACLVAAMSPVPVSEVEKTIEDAERAQLHPAMLI